jgi:putative endonuclease
MLLRDGISAMDVTSSFRRTCARFDACRSFRDWGTLPAVTSERALRGAACEAIAASYLEKHGLEIVARNLRCKAGEIDLVCLDGQVLAVVEVRQRRSRDYGGALASVNARKQRKIVLAARYLLERHASRRHLNLRFDVVAVQGTPEEHDIVWIKDAFQASPFGRT